MSQGYDIEVKKGYILCYYSLLCLLVSYSQVLYRLIFSYKTTFPFYIYKKLTFLNLSHCLHHNVYSFY